jgi:carboxymethylenebutenolidase
VRFDLARRDDPMSAVIRAAMNHLSNERVAEDTGGLIAFLDAQAEVAPGPVGCVGHCMSGQFITTAAARYPSRMAAAASLYGVGIVTDSDDSPHLLLNRIKGELYYGFAETDHTVPEHVIPTLTSALEEAGTRHEVEIHPGTQHGFCFAERPAYSPEAAERAWAKCFSLWERNLK